MDGWMDGWKEGWMDGGFVCVDALRPSQQFFSHVGTEPPLPGYYQYFSGS